MLRTLSFKELEICDSAERKAYFSKSIKYWHIAYVYFIRHKKRIIYIGCTINPYTREINHNTNLYKKGISDFTITFIGPFELSLAEKIEAFEISKRAKSKYLLNKKSKKQVYGKEFSIKNFRQKGISHTRKGGKEKALVCEHTY